MGKIHNVFSLEDRFSSTFGRYLQLAQQASGQTLTAKAAAQSYSVSVQTEAANMAQAAQMASVQQQTAVQAAAASSQQTAAVHTQAAEEVIRTQQQLSTAQQEAATAVTRHSEALKSAEASARNYQSVLGSIERQVIKANARFDALYEQEQELIAAGEQTTAAFKKLDAQLDKQGASVRFLEAQQSALTQKYNAATAAVQSETAALSRAQAAETQAAQAATSAASAAQELASAQTHAAETAGQAESAAKRAANANREFKDSSGLAAKSADSLTQALKQLVGGYLGIQTLKKASDLSDTLVSTRTRLDQMNDGLQTTAELETMIYQAAQNSRGSFVDTLGLVSQLGTMAGSAFNNTQEVVLFAEQLNKKLALSGAPGMAAQAAILQLEQGLASGVLRGDELNSVMEQTPALAKTIADYLQVSIGDLRTMGSEGKITAAIVKNALFSAAEETNAAFEKTPMTWAQVWTTATNIAVRALDPLLSGINWVANNLETIVPVVLSVGAAFVVFQTLTNLTQAWTVAITLARGALMLLSPQGFAIAAIAGIIYAGAGAFMDFAETGTNAAGIVVGTFYALGAWLYNSFIVPLWSMFAAAGNFIRNVFNDPVSSIEFLFFDMEIAILKIFKNIADGAGRLIGLIPGLENNFATNFANYLDGQITQTSRDLHYAKWASGYTNYYKAPKEMNIDRAYTTGFNVGSNIDLSSLFGIASGAGSIQIPQAANLNDLLKNIDKNTSKIAKTVDMSDEQIKMLVDVAERKYVNNINLTSQTPMITIKGQNTGNTEQDARNVAEILRDTLLELRSAGSTVTVQ